MSRTILRWLLARDIRVTDLGLGLLGAALIMGSCALTLAGSGLGAGGSSASVDPGLGVPISVTPVADGASGSASELKVGAAWRSPVEKTRPAVTRESPDAATSEAVAATAPTDTIPNAAVEPVEPVDSSPAAAPAASADAADSPDLVDPFAADAATAGAPGAADSTGSPDEPAGEGAGAAGSGDPLYERAVAFYRARLVAWFSSQFKVSGSGLSQDELARHRVRVEIQVAEDLTISGYRVLDATHPTFEDAARRTIDRLLRKPLPAPPENYPGAVQRRVVVTFSCSEDACD